MPEFLVFTLAAQIASFGGLAGHERRGSDTWPGRSALIGLLGAAMGTRRNDTAGQAALADLSFAVGALNTGVPLRDYHTVQTVPRTHKRPATRAAALRAADSKGDLNTLITQRDYRCGVLYTVALWGGGVPLSSLKAALERPHFVLYLGRKSCPLSALTCPRIVSAADPVEALRHAQLPHWHEGPTVPAFIASDWTDAIAGYEPSTEWRHDEPRDRQGWHFAARQVRFLRPTDKDTGAAA